MVKKVKVRTEKSKKEEEGIGPYGEIFFSWDFPEFEKRERGIFWYVAIGIIAIGLLLWAILKEQNYLFVGIIVIVLIIIFITSRREPKTISIQIAEDGIEIDRRFFTYDRIKKFWIAYEPPVVKILYLRTTRSTQPTYSIPIGDIDPLKLREQLLEYIEEDLDQDGETSSDAWDRVLKL